MMELMPDAYVTNELRLYEIVQANDRFVWVRNVCTEFVFCFPKAVVAEWREVLPTCPDTADSLV